LRKRVRVRPHSNHRADPRTAHQAGSPLQRGSIGSNVTYCETGQRSALSCYRISPRGLSFEATFVLKIGSTGATSPRNHLIRKALEEQGS
jgi:hypothetical protein